MHKQSKIKNQQSTIASSGRGLFAVAGLAFAISLISLSYYFQRSEILLYGDAVAHINIARRVFDSQTPGWLQLGTVWLPLPHLLMIPFLISDAMWQTGIGGSIPSIIAYVLGVAGVFRLTRTVAEPQAGSLAALGPWLAALVYAANPNLIYLQTTAMTEPVYLAFVVWAIVFLVEFVQAEAENTTTQGILRLRSGQAPVHEGNTASVWKCAVCVAGAELTRYDGWLLGGVIGLAMTTLAFRRWQDQQLRWAALKFVVAIAIAPAAWLVYNAMVYGNPLEFANGPYSAKAVEQRTATPSMPTYPGRGNVVLAASYFLKAAELDMASGNWGRIWIVIGLGGLIATCRRIRRNWPLFLFWLPLFFYAFSIAYGGVPLFLPLWWPFTFYNLRYGLELLPLFAVSAGLIVTIPRMSEAPKASQTSPATPSQVGWPDLNPVARTLNLQAVTSNFRIALVSITLLIVGLSYFSVWKTQPVCFKEARLNSRTKFTLEAAVARTIRGLPRASHYLMYLGDHVGVFQQAGIPLRQTINEGNHQPWKRPQDQEGLWERALADPAKYVNFVIAFAGDPVDRAVDKNGLTLLTVIHTTGESEARIYAARPE
jgi:hypothetical protein